MLGGHYTTALVAKQYFPKGSLLYFLAMSQLPDLLWVSFHFIGIEETHPSSILKVSLDNLIVQMIYSHDLLPMFVWVVVAYLIGFLLFKHKGVGLAGSILVAVHAFVDYIGGYPHNIFGTNTHSVGTGLYYTYPYLAVMLEALFTLVILLWFFRNEKANQENRSRRSKGWILGIFIFNIIFMFSIADLSMVESMAMLGVEIPESSLKTTMPSLLMTYLLFIYLINRAFFIDYIERP